jgi:hypothetical protein
MSNLAGIHLANGPQDIARVVSLGCDHYLALDLPRYGDTPSGIEYLQQCPGSRYLRLTHRATDSTADIVASAKRAYERGIRDVTPWNEANIESPDLTYAQVADHFLAVRKKVTDLGGLILHLPPLSPSRGYREHAAEWLPAARMADVVDVHAYGSCQQILEIVDWYHSVLPDKELLLTEVNAGAGNVFDQAWWAREYLALLEALQSRPWCIAAIGFIWQWHRPDMALPTTVDWIGQPIEAAVRNARKPERRAWQNGGSNVDKFEYTLGFATYAQAHPEIGKPTSHLMYDANGTAVQYTEKGMLHWVKASNQTLFFRAEQAG